MEIKKILYIGGFELPDKNAAAHRVLNNSKLFEKNGFSVEYIGIYKNSPDSKKSILSKIIDTPVKYPRKIMEWISYLSSIKHIKKYVKNDASIKIIVAYNYPSIGLRKLMFFCKKKELQLISDCTEWYGAQGSSIILKLIKGLDSFYRMRILNKKVDGLIVISDYLKNYYDKHRVKLLNIPPLIDCHDEIWNKEQLINKSLVLTYTGQPGKQKDNIIDILSLICSAPKDFDVTLNVIGVTNEQFKMIYRENISIINDYRIVFHGRVSHSRSIDILSKSDFLVFFRNSNIANKAGFPTKFVEATTLGIPTITNNISNISDYLKNGISGVVYDFSQQSSVVEVLQKWNENKYLYKKNIVRNSFCTDNFLDEMHAFLKSVQLKT